jgi:hypothetical protein
MARLETTAALRRFDHDTGGLFVGLLGTLSLVAWACVTLFQEHQPPKVDVREITSQVKYDSSRTAGTSAGADLSLNLTSDSVVSEGPAQGVSQEALAVSINTGEVSASSSIAVLSPGTNPSPAALANEGEPSVPSPPGFVRKIRGKAAYRRYRASGQLEETEVKRRLLELWHRSLAQSEKAKSWAMLSKLDKRMKAATNARREGTLKAHPNLDE